MSTRLRQKKVGFEMTSPSSEVAKSIVAIDASRNRSGGAKTHLLGILGAVDPRDHGIEKVHVWSYRKLLDALPDAPWLVKHNPQALERSLIHQGWWQRWHMPREVRAAGCNVLLTTCAGSIGRFSPSVVMSRDMLSFESGEIDRFGWSTARLRLLLLLYFQVWSLRRASAALFLTHYAADVIQQFTGPLESYKVIPHGISETFRTSALTTLKAPATVRCVYVSNSDLYKHQWHVVEAIATLRKRGHPITLQLVGAGAGRAAALKRLATALERHDPAHEFVEVVTAVSHDQIPSYLRQTDIFVFASSCENMPNTLVEAMASGLPIACSRRGPMPEILQHAGELFDPEDPASIASAIETLLVDPQRRADCAREARRLSNAYSWTRCATETWALLREVHAARRDVIAPITSRSNA